MAPPQPIPYPADPADPFLFIMEMQSAFNRRHRSSVISKGIGRNDPAVLPAFPPAFAYGCTDLLHRPDILDGTPFAPSRFCRMLLPNAKPWNPDDPCLIEAAQAYWDNIDKTGKYYQDAHMMNARKLNDQLLRIERERVACRAGCDFSWGACEARCDETAETLKHNWNRAYQNEKERLDREEKVVNGNLERGFWVAARACGYDAGSFGTDINGTPVRFVWGGPVPILRAFPEIGALTALTTPITPVFITEFFGRLPPPPPIGSPIGGGGFLSTGLNNYSYDGDNGYANTWMSLYLRMRLGLGNRWQSWWPYSPMDFPQDWWMPNVTEAWNDFFAECGDPPPRGQGLSGVAQTICAAQKHHYLWQATRRASERNMGKAASGR